MFFSALIKLSKIISPSVCQQMITQRKHAVCAGVWYSIQPLKRKSCDFFLTTQTKLENIMLRKKANTEINTVWFYLFVKYEVIDLTEAESGVVIGTRRWEREGQRKREIKRY